MYIEEGACYEMKFFVAWIFGLKEVKSLYCEFRENVNKALQRLGRNYMPVNPGIFNKIALVCNHNQR